MNDSKRIAYIVSMFPCYSETFVLRELQELRRNGVEISIFSLRKFKEPVLSAEAKEFIPDTFYSPFVFSNKTITLFLKTAFSKPVFLLKTVFKTMVSKSPLAVRFKSLSCIPLALVFGSEIRKRGIRRIHAHFASYPAYTAWIIHRVWPDITYTFTAHAHDIFVRFPMLKEKVMEAERTITISEFNKRYLLDQVGKESESRIEIIHCGLNPEKYKSEDRNPRENPPLILSVGRMVAKKGFEDLIRAAAILRDKGFFCNLIIIGDGEERAHLEKVVTELNLMDRVEMPGALPYEKVKRFYRDASVFVLPCRTAPGMDRMDGVPVVLMEAMASGLPVISTPISGIPELILDHETGVLVDQGSQKKLASSIEKLIMDRKLANRLSENAQKLISKSYNISTNVKRLIHNWKWTPS